MKFIVNGGRKLKGAIDVRGSKNAALPALAATILSKRPCILDNLPLIGDIFTFISTLQAMGSQIDWLEEHKVRIDNSRLSPKKMPRDLICKIRASVLLLGPILARFGEVKISTPGGCHIGPRPIDIHLDAFRELGFSVRYSKDQDIYHIRRERRRVQKEITLNGLTVTGTENLLMYAALHPLKIKIAAIEPHIEDLGRLLVKMGAKINGFGSHTLEVKKPINSKGGVIKHSIMYDPIEAGTFIILAAATKSDIRIKHVPIDDLTLTLRKLEEFGVKFETRGQDVFVKGSRSKLTAVPRLVAQEHPGIPTDLQAPFGVLATQAKGETLIFDTIYEGRLKYLYELDKMGASIDILDSHRARIKGPAQLVGKNVESIDLRAGATLVIAALVARGESVLHQAEQIDRGYEKIDERLRMIKADIRRVE
ncbi:MAG: UDP-N-acetylglucosamine 1-carboxyvinyltransferase [Candidatus Colwellbacteria bacterium]|nr:UDP-N-acetylglucosamine 1-carboxyvinyltransferase [Candidatus Colwellbacteria bacterium]